MPIRSTWPLRSRVIRPDSDIGSSGLRATSASHCSAAGTGRQRAGPPKPFATRAATVVQCRHEQHPFRAAHVPGARLFDIDAASDTSSSLPHTLPSDADFPEFCAGLGIGGDTGVVVYDATGENTGAGRAWWQLRAFGHRRVSLLDGGLGRWRAEGRLLEAGPGTHRPARGRFEGTEPEPRPGLRSGHVPGARSLPWSDRVEAGGRMRRDAELRSLIEGAGIDPFRPVIVMCGSGGSACSLILAFRLLGLPEPALYDGSWFEWGRPGDTLLETGPARPGTPPTRCAGGCSTRDPRVRA